ncbi:substrate-binding domain-containing protein [Roseomonas gilardii]|uniref:LacI family DNA-binding transcriptional regulator n=1 Tax=Roseomonas gilardii TaxID=257708 RepID=UPI0011A9877E|nr:substrate-binding domain-containing protein [Roseomonas gilardii]
MSRRPVTSREVARRAGVSQSAVSRAFTPGASISPEMRERILAIAEALHYRPNRLPGMMLKGRSGIVAIVMGGYYNPFHTMALEAFTRALSAVGKQALLVQVESDRMLDEAVGELTRLRIDGVLSALSIGSTEVAADLDRHHIPIVTLNSSIETEWVRVINSDNAGAGARAAKLLHASGASRFAFVAGPRDAIAHSERIKGFTHTLSAMGVTSIIGAYGDYTYEWGQDIGKRFLESGERPDGIFCTNDIIAAGLIDIWKEQRDLRAPRDFRIIGYDNIPMAGWAGYNLSSFDQRLDDIAELAVGMLSGSFHDKRASAPVSPDLIVRRSCSPGNEPGPRITDASAAT